MLRHCAVGRPYSLGISNFLKEDIHFSMRNLQLRGTFTFLTIKYWHSMPTGKKQPDIIILQQPGFMVGMLFLRLKVMFFFDRMHSVLFRTKMQFWCDKAKLHILSPHQSHSSVYWCTLGEPIGNNFLEQGHFVG